MSCYKKIRFSKSIRLSGIIVMILGFATVIAGCKNKYDDPATFTQAVFSELLKNDNPKWINDKKLSDAKIILTSVSILRRDPGSENIAYEGEVIVPEDCYQPLRNEYMQKFDLSDHGNDCPEIRTKLNKVVLLKKLVPAKGKMKITGTYGRYQDEKSKYKWSLTIGNQMFGITTEFMEIGTMEKLTQYENDKKILIEGTQEFQVFMKEIDSLMTEYKNNRQKLNAMYSEIQTKNQKINELNRIISQKRTMLRRLEQANRRNSQKRLPVVGGNNSGEVEKIREEIRLLEENVMNISKEIEKINTEKAKLEK